MRLIHTSDWHLGRQFHGENLADAQRAMVDALVRTVRDEQVDVVLIAGDIYDRAIPPLDAIELFDHAIAGIHEAGAAVVATSGNHDSARRLGFGTRFMREAGVHIRSDLGSCGEPVLLDGRHGPVAIYPLPYLEPAVAHAPLGADAIAHQAVVEAAMARVRSDLASRPAGTRSVAIAHAFVVGEGAAIECDSERDLQVGGTAAVSASVFDGVDYVALGHLHRAQQLSPRVAYSGSPVAYSFSEAGHAKSFTLVDLDADGDVSTRHIPAPVVHPLVRLKGTLDELLEDPELDRHVSSFLEVTLTDATRPPEAMKKLRKRFDHVLQLRFSASLRPGDDSSYRNRVQGRSDIDVCRSFVAHVRGSEATLEEVELFHRALTAQQVAQVE